MMYGRVLVRSGLVVMVVALAVAQMVRAQSGAGVAPVRIVAVGIVAPAIEPLRQAWQRAFDVPVGSTLVRGDARVAVVDLPNLRVELLEPVGPGDLQRWLAAGGAGPVMVELSSPDVDATGRGGGGAGGRPGPPPDAGAVDVLPPGAMRGWVRVRNATGGADRPVAGLGPVRAVGHLMREIEPARAFWEHALGMAVPAARDTRGVPFPPDCGCDRDAYIREVNVRLDGAGLNLIQPVGGDSVWRRMIARYEGLHYLQFTVPGPDGALDARVAALERIGGTRTLGAPGAPYAYVDMTRSLGLTLLLVRGA